MTSRAVTDRLGRKRCRTVFVAKRFRQLGQEHRQSVFQFGTGCRRPRTGADLDSRFRDDRVPISGHELVQHGIPLERTHSMAENLSDAKDRTGALLIGATEVLAELLSWWW